MFTQSRPKMRACSRRWHATITLFIALSAIASGLGVTSPAQAYGDYGPDTCLQGWVWRGAVLGDDVCVTGDTRTQTAYDNSQAAIRRDPNGGPYGPDTCLYGWVWREAVPGDHVCVTGDTRAQAAYDNSQAAARRDSLNLWNGTYTIPPVCYGPICTITSTDDIPRYRLYGDHINTGQVTIQLNRLSDDALLREWTVNATSSSLAPGGQFSLDTDTFVCSGPSDSYFRVFDPISTRWSDPYYVTTICEVL